MERKFISLYESLTGHKDPLLEKFIGKVGETSEKRRYEYEAGELRYEEDRGVEVGVTDREKGAPTEIYVELPSVKGIEGEHISAVEPVEEKPILEPSAEEIRPSGSEAEYQIESFHRTEEFVSEETEKRKIMEKIEGKKKVVEGVEDVKRKIVVSVDIDEEFDVGEKIPSNGHLKHEEEKDKIGYMGEDEKKLRETEDIEEQIKKEIFDEIKRARGLGDVGKGEVVTKEYVGVRERVRPKPIIQEIIDKIRSDIISRAENEARRRIDEARKEAMDIIANAQSEAERTINEAVARSIEISREIEKEAEERGFKAGFDKGYEEGKVRGYEDAYKKTLSEGRYALEMVRKTADEVAYAKERFSDDFPKIVLHLTLVALKTILMTERIKDEELVIRVLKDALNKVKDFQVVKIRINERDFETVKRYFDIPKEFEILPDPSVEKGDVKIEMREGYFESSIKWREKIIENALREELEQLLSSDQTTNLKRETAQEGSEKKSRGEKKSPEERTDSKEEEKRMEELESKKLDEEIVE